MTLRVAYQGTAGAYSEECAAMLFPAAELVGQRTFAAAFDDLQHARADAAVLPVENSTAGAVSDVYDLLLGHEDLTVVGEAILPVRHCLLGLPGATLAGITAARSHPQALAQSEAFLRAHGIEPREAYDTAGATDEVREAGDPSVAAVASSRAGERAGLVVLAADIQTVADNSTRFFVLARSGDTRAQAAMSAAHRAGDPKTSLVFATDDRPGALVRALQPFATAGVNLAKIESRPSRDRPWTYVFYLDIHGDIAASPAREALALLRTCCSWVRVLGTYPMAQQTASAEAPAGNVNRRESGSDAIIESLLQATPWASLADAYGPASALPEILRARASPDAQIAQTAVEDLWSRLCHQGTLYEATAPAVPILAQLAGETATSDRVDLLLLLTAIARGSSYADVHQRGTPAEVTRELQWVRSARDAVRRVAPSLLDRFPREPPASRVALAALAVAVPAVGADYRGTFEKEYNRSSQKYERAAYAAALVALGARDPAYGRTLTELRTEAVDDELREAFLADPISSTEFLDELVDLAITEISKHGNTP